MAEEDEGAANGLRVNEPLGVKDAIRPLSVQLFLAVFIPTAIAVGGALGVLLEKSSEMTTELKVLQEQESRLADAIKGLSTESHQLAATEIPGLRGTLEYIRGKLDSQKPSQDLPNPPPH